MAAAESPKSRNKVKTPVKAVTIPTNPKSFGPRSRAKTIREPTRIRKLAPWAQSLARPPRIVFPFRSAGWERSVSLYGRQEEEEVREKVSRIRHGLGLTGIGDARGLVCKRSCRGSAAINRAAAHVLHH